MLHATNKEQADEQAFDFFVAAVLAVCFALRVQAQQQVTVPNVVGMTTDQAVKTLEAAGLRGSIGFDMTSNQASAVKVTVAPNGMEAFGETVMPLVYGKTYAEAKAALEKAGLSYDKATKEYTLLRARDDKLIAGAIREQRPAAGTRIAKTTQVWLRGYSCQPPPNVTVPSVRNLPFDAAGAKLQAAGLHYGNGSMTTVRKELDRKVADQAPGGASTTTNCT